MPAEKSWTTGQLASHIAEVYNWYQPPLHKDVFDMAGYKYDKGDITSVVNIIAKFEDNVKNAQAALETATDDSMFVNWKMVMGSEERFFLKCPGCRWCVAFSVTTLPPPWRDGCLPACYRQQSARPVRANCR